MSTETIGSPEFVIRERAVSNGGRTGGWKENPNRRTVHLRKSQIHHNSSPEYVVNGNRTRLRNFEILETDAAFEVVVA